MVDILGSPFLLFPNFLPLINNMLNKYYVVEKYSLAGNISTLDLKYTHEGTSPCDWSLQLVEGTIPVM